MKRIVNKKFGINLLLIIVTLIVWGVITSHLLKYFEASEENKPEIINTNDISGSFVQNQNKFYTANIEWIKLDRDPFQLMQAMIQKEVLAMNKSNKQIKPKETKNNLQVMPMNLKPEKQNNLIVTGIILNSNSKLAVLLDLSVNKTIFLREGESYDGTVIKEIRDNSIIIIIDGVEIKELVINH